MEKQMETWVEQYSLPRHLNHLMPLLLAQSLSRLGFETQYLAFQDGYLYRPKDPHDGEFLTLAFIDYSYPVPNDK